MTRSTKFVLPVGKRGGITKREAFAVLMMQSHRRAFPEDSSIACAKNAIDDADALIAALGNQPTEEGEE